MTAKTHILTISVEDYFHVGTFEGSVLRKHWGRFESRLEENIDKVLDLLAKYDTKATFFVFGWIAERQPQIIRKIVAQGHEIASSGYWPKTLQNIHPEELRMDLRRSKEALEAAGSNRIVGFRDARNWLAPKDLWILDLLAEEGYLYDSSVNPILRRYRQDPRRYELHRHRHSSVGNLSIWEFPISTAQMMGVRVTISGGNYIRQLPHPLLKRAVRKWDENRESPLVFYFMPWEIDKDQPFLSSLPRLSRIRHYRNLAKTAWVIEEYLQTYKFQPISTYLNVPISEPRKPVAMPIDLTPVLDPARRAALPQITMVIPLYNEELTVGYLMRTILEFRRRLEMSYRIHLILVDDGSSDGTWAKLTDTFQGVEDCRIIRHGENQGVAAAIMTGIRAATTDTVCSIDCDCSYDPDVLETMIPMLAEADMVTASPYHPQGKVFNVPPWRLFLSKTLCRMYSLVLKQRIHTFTSCCRVYRQSAMAPVQLEYRGFLGVAEMLIRLKLRGGVLRECPATLESRLFGESKMKIFRTILGHLKFLARLNWEKLSKREGAIVTSVTSVAVRPNSGQADPSAITEIMEVKADAPAMKTSTIKATTMEANL